MADTAVVTGAARGIGRAIATRLAREGWSVVVADLDAAELAVVATELGALAVPGDTSTDAGVRELLDAAYAHLGHVDAFFANAGIGTLAGLEATDAAVAAGARHQRHGPRACGPPPRAALARGRAVAASSSPRRPRVC